MQYLLRLLSLLVISFALSPPSAEPAFAGRECQWVFNDNRSLLRCPSGWDAKSRVISAPYLFGYERWKLYCCRNYADISMPRCGELPACGAGRRAECAKQGSCISRNFGGGRSPRSGCITWRCVNPAVHRR